MDREVNKCPHEMSQVELGEAGGADSERAGRARGETYQPSG